MGSCARDQVLTPATTVHCKERCNERATTMAAVQRIKVLTPLQHSALLKTLQRAQ
jgi:hypothetical protein